LRNPKGGEPNSVNLRAGADFLAVYSGDLPTSAAGQIWDVDMQEDFLIQALDGSNLVLATVDPPPGPGPSPTNNPADGLPVNFVFEHLSDPIKTIRISMTGASDPNPGFGFDNFNATGTEIPIPGAVWLLGSGLIGIVGIRRIFRG
jgi:hypothetical protein